MSSSLASDYQRALVLGIDLGSSSLKIVLMQKICGPVDTNGHGSLPQLRFIASASSAPIPLNRRASVSTEGDLSNFSTYAEQNPHDWLIAFHEALEKLSSQTVSDGSSGVVLVKELLRAVESISCSGQMHGSVLLDEKGSVLHPCLLWCDGRAEAEGKLLSTLDDELLVKVTGNLVMPGFTAPKVLWLKKHEPDVYGEIHTIMLPKDYLTMYLLRGGIPELVERGSIKVRRLKAREQEEVRWRGLTEMSDASGTSWLDPFKREWSDEVVKRCELPRTVLPKLMEGNEVVGNVNPDLASILFGDDERGKAISVVAGASDNAASALGMRITPQNSQLMLSLGTSGVCLSVEDSPGEERDADTEQQLQLRLAKRALHTFCHALPGQLLRMAVTLSAAASFAWFAEKIAHSSPFVLLQELDEALRSKAQGASEDTPRRMMKTSVLFFPYLNGERSPYNDPNMTGSFFGLTSSTERWEMTLAILEGVTMSLWDAAEKCNMLEPSSSAACGKSTKAKNAAAIVLLGGGSRSTIWASVVANVFEREVLVMPNSDTAAAIGAATLAAMALPESFNCQQGKECPDPFGSPVAVPTEDLVVYFRKKKESFRRLVSVML